MLAKGSESWLFTATLVTAVFAVLSRATNNSHLNHATYIAMALTLFMVLFFRDPERKVEVSDTYMISPADGTVIDIRDRKICIFMFLQNVHVNRAPISGKIREITYKTWVSSAFCKDSEKMKDKSYFTEYGDVSSRKLQYNAGELSLISINDFIEQGSAWISVLDQELM